jgi:hypothetical protein
MAALEYLTSNSLISYPFKSGRAVLESNNHPIEDNWFYDILFTSFSDDIRSVYISKIKKTNTGALELTFSNTENLSVLGVATIASNNLVDHYKNAAKSFASYSSLYFAVKLVFGPGLIAKTAFEQNYNFSEASLASAAVILNSPRLATLTFEAYNFDLSVSTTPTIEEVMVYSYPEVPTVQPRYNSRFTLDSLNSGSLHILRGAGAGLYDPCPANGFIDDVYSLSNVLPNSSGALFLNTSSCYTANVLSGSNETLYGTYLYKYRVFEILTSPLTTATVNVVHVGHSITFENFCKPKCPHENLNAYAHYLNRVSDGAQDLDTAVSKSSETRGQGSSVLKVFTAHEFCVTGDAVFDRCSDPSDSNTHIACGDSFLKNYHEGRTFQIYYDNMTVRNYTVVEVIDEFNVRLSGIPPQAQGEAALLSFRILDNGVISNLNCAALAYNQNAESFLKTYYTVAYTTNEAYNADRVYTTNLAVVVALYNPSPSTVQLRIDFTPSILTQVGSYKIRTAESIYTLETSELSLGCREYAFVETVFAIPCETAEGFLDIDVLEKIGTLWTMVGDTFRSPEIAGAECPGTVEGKAIKFRVTQQSGDSFSEAIELPVGTRSVSQIYGSTPDWLTSSFNSVDSTLELSASDYPQSNTSQRYSLYFRSYSAASTVIWQLMLDYVAAPEVLSPLGSKFTSQSPLVLSKENVYTEDSPVFQVFATNMLILSQDFEDSATTFFYSISLGTLPEGLTFNPVTGAVTGQVDPSVQTGSTYTLVVTATNPSESATNPQIIHLSIAIEAPPIISLISPPEYDVYVTNNLDVHTLTQPLVALSATNTPIYSYTIEGDLPPGLLFNRTLGVITGKVNATSAGSSELSIYTDNVYGSSNTVSINIEYEIYFKPSITYPAIAQVINASIFDESSLASPLFTVAALQAYGEADNYAEGLTNTTRNSYLAAGIPPGFTLDTYTGKFYGKLADTEIPENPTGQPYRLPYVVRLGAYNPVGSDSRSIFIYFYSTQAPVIINIFETGPIAVVKDKTYNVNNPLFTFKALNAPDTFSAEGLPVGLTCTSAGLLVGTVASAVAAGTYTVTVTASNSHGTSDVSTFYFSVPISLLSPAVSDFDVIIYETATDLFSVTVCDTLEEDSVDVTVTGLPVGFSYTDGSVSGVSSKLGKYSVKITASSTSHGTVTRYLILNITPISYTVSGTVLDRDGAPVSDIIISDGRNRTVLTGLDGKYNLFGLQSGSYNILADSDSYAIIPRFAAVELGVASVKGVDFTAEQATRLISGVILDEQFNGVFGVIVTDGVHETTTNSFGRYELYVTGYGAVTITPKSTAYVFDPASGVVDAGTEGRDDANFGATASHAAAAPGIISVTPGNRSIEVIFTSPSDTGLTAIVNYEYSTDAGISWAAITPAKITSPLTISSVSSSSALLVNGVAYDISIRAVNASGGGTSSIISTVSPASVAAAPTITSYTSGATGANVYFTAPVDNGGSAVIDYEYSTNDGTTYILANRRTSPIEVRNLILGTTYAFKLRAVNSMGIGAATGTYSLVMAAIPTPPTITSIAAGDEQLVVSFTEPSSTGGVPLANVGYSIDGGSTFSVPDPAVIASPVTIPGLQNGVAYYVALRAINATGNYSASSDSVLSTPTELPEPPTELSVLSIDGGLTITFVPPSNASIPINNYKYQIADGLWLPITPSKAGSPVTIKGLTNGTEYSVKLKAIVAAGDGSASEPVLGTPAKPPGAPILTSIVTANTELTVFFTKPTNTGGLPLLGYSHSTNAGSSYTASTVTELTSTTAKVTITGLVNGTNYTIYLKARTAAGLGSMSNSLLGTPSTTASAPSQLIAAVDNNSAAISFTPPASTGGAAITNYKYQLNDSPWVTRTPAASSSILLLNNLVNGRTYDLKIKAVNAAGDGEESPSLTFTPAARPTAPTIRSIVANDKRLQLIFTASANAGGIGINSYEYSLDGGVSFITANTPNIGAAVGDSLETPYILIFNLANGTTYDVVLRAVNAAGTSPVSNKLSGKPVGPPPAPSITKISSTPTGALIYFTAPATNGGATITNYAYLATDEDGTEVTATRNPVATTSPLNVSGLTAGVEYSFKLWAINTYGAGSLSGEVYVTPGAPPVPTITSIIAKDAELVVNFTLPVVTGSLPVTDYIYSLNAGESFTSAQATSSPIRITGLVNGTSYNVVLRAVNSVSVGDQTNKVSATPTNRPSVPTITAIYTQEEAIAIYFTEPTSDGGSPILGYKYSTDGTTFIPFTSTSNPLSISGLITGLTYNIYIRAFNSSGDGAVSGAVSVTVGAPEAPTIDSISATSNSVEIYFTPPGDSGSPLLNHEYSLNSSATWTAFNPAATEGPLVLTNQLTANTRYSIRIRALNSRGAGAPSTAAGIYKGDAPVPQIASIQPGDGKLTLSILPPGNYTKTIVDYKYNIYTTDDENIYTSANASVFPIVSLTIPNDDN